MPFKLLGLIISKRLILCLLYVKFVKIFDYFIVAD